MTTVFLKIVNMSISAGWLVLAVLLLRAAFRKAPKWADMALWGIVAVRLICPFTVESSLSLIPSDETISPAIMTDAEPRVYTGIPALNDVVNPLLQNTVSPDPAADVNPLRIWIPAVAAVWAAGLVLLLLYAAASFWRLGRRVNTAVLYRGNIFRSENVDSPFVLGIVKPRIYLPFKVDGENMECVIAHERAHIRRKDHWWKPLGFLLLAVHWFNPLMWLSYILLCRDIELACDEKVIRELDHEQRADYTQALLACSAGRRCMLSACPLAFGEVGVKKRIKSVLNFKKPAFWAVALSAAACLVVAVCFLTSPKQDGESGSESNPADQFDSEAIASGNANNTVPTEEGSVQTKISDASVSTVSDAYTPAVSDPTVPGASGPSVPGASDPSAPAASTADSLTSAVSNAILRQDADSVPAGCIHVESHIWLGNETRTGTDGVPEEIVYLYTLEQTFSTYGGELKEESGSAIPTAITFSVSDSGGYTLKEYWIPRDGSFYAVDIREKFPKALAEKVLSKSQLDISKLHEECRQRASDALKSFGSLSARIEELLNIVQSSPAQSSAPEDYIATHGDEWGELLSYGKFSVRYCFDEFLKGGRTDLKGQLMYRLCREIMESQGFAQEDTAYPTGQEWFDSFRQNAEKLAASDNYGQDYLEKYRPYEHMLIEQIVIKQLSL